MYSSRNEYSGLKKFHLRFQVRRLVSFSVGTEFQAAGSLSWSGAWGLDPVEHILYRHLIDRQNGREISSSILHNASYH